MDYSYSLLWKNQIFKGGILIKKNISCLVIGSRGFIGSNLVSKLKELEYNIYEADIKIKSSYNVEFPLFLEEFESKNIDFIFHFGAPCSILQFNEDLIGSFRNTVFGFQNVLKLAKISRAKLIYNTSGNVYGLSPSIEYLRPEPVNTYGLSKYICENIARNENGVKSIGLRFFTGYGKFEEKKGPLASVVCHFLQDMMAGKQPVIWGDGEQLRDCVYIDDIVEACIKAMHVNSTEVVNVGTGLGHTYNQIVKTINEVLHTNIKPIYKDKPSNYVDKACASTEWCEELLKWRPQTNLRTGLERFYEYLKKC